MWMGFLYRHQQELPCGPASQTHNSQGRKRNQNKIKQFWYICKCQPEIFLCILEFTTLYSRVDSCPVVYQEPGYVNISLSSGLGSRSLPANSVVGPFMEGSELLLVCESGGGKPIPQVRVVYISVHMATLAYHQRGGALHGGQRATSCL